MIGKNLHGHPRRNMGRLDDMFSPDLSAIPDGTRESLNAGIFFALSFS